LCVAWTSPGPEPLVGAYERQAPHEWFGVVVQLPLPAFHCTAGVVWIEGAALRR
jgi:hypothetical protein